MVNKIFWFLFLLSFLTLFYVLIYFPVTSSGGDLAEYFGMTESIINHGSINLTKEDYESLKKYLNPGYFVDSEETEWNGGFLYYLPGKDGQTHPVHFFAYSLISIPIRILFRLFNLNELLTFRIINAFMLYVTFLFIFLKYVKSIASKVILYLLILFSPIVSFLIWPGPDIYYLCLLLIGTIMFFRQKYFQSSLFVALASWHSQPLVITSLMLLIFSFFYGKNIKRALFILGILAVPYIFNYYFFGVLTPWTLLDDGWTKLYGFGLHNASLKKLFEQFFDLNVGLFWYAPLYIIISFFYFLKNVKSDGKIAWIFITILVTAFFYQTNPAWHYGTAGYGPSRHILFVLPFFIYIAFRWVSSARKGIALLAILVLSQIFILSQNGFLMPKFENSLDHTYIAKYFLNNFPSLYNPTPEIFVDRTNHSDLKFIKTAIYKNNGECKKAFVMPTDTEFLRRECGFIPQGYEDSFGKGVYVNF